MVINVCQTQKGNDPNIDLSGSMEALITEKVFIDFKKRKLTMEYLKETVTVDVYGTATPVGTIGDYLFIETPKTAKLLYKRLNRNRPSSNNNLFSIDECTEFAVKLQKNFSLQRLEEEMLYYESNPIKVDLHAEDDGTIDPTGFFESHGLAETKAELETLHKCIYEGSHSALRYVYRIGFDVDTGRQVAVQFIIEPNKITALLQVRLKLSPLQVQFIMKPKKITAVGYNKLTSNVVSDVYNGRLDPKKVKIIKNSLHKAAIDEVNIKIGHIENKTNALKVNAIFTRDHQSLKKVKMVPMFNKKVLKTIRAFDNLLQKSGKAPELMSYCDLVKTPEFLKKLKECIKTANVETEEYIVGKECGADKYKTTKLFWDSSESKFFAFYHRDF